MNSFLHTSTRCTRLSNPLLVRVSNPRRCWAKTTRFSNQTRFLHDGNTTSQRNFVAPSQPQASVDVVNSNKTWVDRLPPRIRPYLYLTRIDKPIGTVLLYLPCSMLSSSFLKQKRNKHIFSMVDNNGVVRPSHSLDDAAHISELVWDWRAHHAWGGVYDQ